MQIIGSWVIKEMSVGGGGGDFRMPKLGRAASSLKAGMAFRSNSGCEWVDWREGFAYFCHFKSHILASRHVKTLMDVSISINYSYNG
jgi:hypothetical protein